MKEAFLDHNHLDHQKICPQDLVFPHDAAREKKKEKKKKELKRLNKKNTHIYINESRRTQRK